MRNYPDRFVRHSSRFVLFPLLLALAAGCASSSRTAGPVADLSGTRWTVVSIDGNAPLRGDEALSVEFSVDGRVSGAILRSEQGDAAVQSRLGVVLATGGFSRHPELRLLHSDEPNYGLAMRRGILAARGDAQAVGVFVDEAIDRISVLADALRLGVLQLHGSETIDDTWALRSSTAAKIWKAIRVRYAQEARALIEEWTPHVDGILLDGWSPNGAGGTGTRFDWQAMRDVRTHVPAHVKVIAAGGLRVDNVREAIAALSPDIVDVSSGVESAPGRKDAGLIAEFCQAVRDA